MQNTILLDSKEAASHLGFSLSTLNNSRCTGLLAGRKAPPHKKIGKSIRYERKALETWLSQFEDQTSTSDHAA